MFFSKQLYSTELGILDFRFRKIQGTLSAKYHVSVPGPGEVDYHFDMNEVNNHWKIVRAPQPPGWIIDMEHSLSIAINEDRQMKESFGE